MSTKRTKSTAERLGSNGGHGRVRLVSLSILIALLAVAFYGGYAMGTIGAQASSPIYLDAEYDFIGAARTWPAEPNARMTDPFGEDQALIEAGRTVCTRAGDEDMSFGAMADLLNMTPHQTYVVMAEARDKLCASQATHLASLMEG